MGYKLAGFDVIGMNEIDPRMAACYIENHKPKYSFIEPIQTFKDRDDLPAELYDLDILDGSPPCSSFSDANNKGSKDWGKEKKFREGQAKQVLDTLFFDFIELAKRLQPKVVIAENVAGLLFDRCAFYLKEIYKRFEDAGYVLQHHLLDAKHMGVPQQRKRVFFIAIRKDIANTIVDFSEKSRLISFAEATEDYWGFEFDEYSIEKYAIGKEWYNTPIGNHSGRKYLQLVKPNPQKPCNTIVAKSSCKSAASVVHPYYCRKLNSYENIICSTFPLDYEFLNEPVAYICGMSVPPVMMANIANRVHEQIFLGIKPKTPQQQKLF